MALLQISEPGTNAAFPHPGWAVGIDLGTTNSLIASVQNGRPIVLGDAQGHPMLPSVVHYAVQKKPEVGYSAQEKQRIDPRNTIVSVKRFMGRSVSDIPYIKETPYEFIDAAGMLKLQTVAGPKSPVEISAEILRELRQRAEVALGGEVAGAVITVPAYFDDAQRQATKDAARLAGLKLLRLLNEPTAAAIAYGLDNASEGIYAVFDLGGGTFDISILKLTRGVFEVLATNGNSALGGDDFDREIFTWILEQTRLSDLALDDVQKGLTEARRAKELLTVQDQVSIDLILGGKNVALCLTQAQFAAMTQPLIQSALSATRQALTDANLQLKDIQGVVMVGGASRMRHIQQAVGEFFQQQPLNNLDPEKVVALGAAIQANLLAGNRSENDILLLDVIPLSLGIETMGGLVEKIIPRNSGIPVAKAQEFTTYKDGQTAMSIHVIQGERELVTDCRSLAKFELKGIPPMGAGKPRIRVTFQVDADGLLNVSARELSTGIEASIDVKPAYGLSNDEITEMLKASFSHAKEDIEARALREQLVDGARLVDVLHKALAEDGELLDVSERSQIESCLVLLGTRMQGTDLGAIKAAIEALNEVSEEFAARRMNKSIRQALTGRDIEKIDV